MILDLDGLKKGKNSTDHAENNQTKCRSFPCGAIVDKKLLQLLASFFSFVPQVCVLLWLFIAFSSFKLLLLSLKSTKQKLPKTSKAFLFKAQHKCDVTLYREWRKFDFHARLPKHSLSSETAKQIIHVVKKKKKNRL